MNRLGLGLSLWIGLCLLAAATGAAAAGDVFDTSGYNRVVWVDFDAQPGGDGASQATPLDTLRPFMYPDATVETHGFVGQPLENSTVFRLRGRGDLLTGSFSPRFAQDIALVPWPDGQPWEIAGFIEITPEVYPHWTAGERKGYPNRIHTVDLSSFFSEFRDFRGRDDLRLTMAARGYEPEFPQPNTDIPLWQPQTPYRVGDVVKVAADSELMLRARVSGTSGLVPPSDAGLLGSVVSVESGMKWVIQHPDLHTVTARDVFVPMLDRFEDLDAAVTACYLDTENELLHFTTPTDFFPGTFDEPAWQIRLMAGCRSDLVGTVAAPNLIRPDSINGLHIQGGRMLICPSDGVLGQPRAMNVQGCDNVVIRDMYIAYPGDDSIAIVNGSPTNVLVENITVVAPGADTAFVAFTQNNSNVIRGVRFRNCDVHQTRNISYGGTTTTLGRSRHGASFASHISTGALPIEDLLFEGCRSIGYGRDIAERTSMPAFSLRDSDGPVGDPLDPMSWPIRVVDCEAFLSVRPPFVTGSYVRTRIGVVGGRREILATTASGALFESCLVTAEATITAQFFSVEGPLYVRNTMVHAPLQSGAAVFGFLDGSSAIAAIDRSVFDTRGLLAAFTGRNDQRGPALGGQVEDLSGGRALSCWLVGVNDYRTPDNNPVGGEPVTRAEFLAAYPGAQMEDGFLFLPSMLPVDVTDLDQAIQTPLRTVVAGEPSAVLDIIGRPDTGLYGPYQFGPVARCSSADIAEPIGVLDWYDVFYFVAAFSAQDPVADLYSEFGVFDSDDVVAFVSAYNRSCGQ